MAEKINQLYAYMVRMKDGEEGILAVDSLTGRKAIVGTDLKEMQLSRGDAIKAARLHDAQVSLACFSKRTDLEVIK